MTHHLQALVDLLKARGAAMSAMKTMSIADRPSGDLDAQVAWDLKYRATVRAVTQTQIAYEKALDEAIAERERV